MKIGCIGLKNMKNVLVKSRHAATSNNFESEWYKVSYKQIIAIVPSTKYGFTYF